MTLRQSRSTLAFTHYDPMTQLRPVLLVLGAIIAVIGAAMILPAIADLASGGEEWRVFARASAVTLLVGLGLWLTARGGQMGLSLRQAFVMTALVWIVGVAFGALPLYWSSIGLTYTDAFFESMSGLTTTGATVIADLEQASTGVLLWRAMLQWLGGLGIIVMAVAVLPMLQIGGMQLFRAEAFDTADKILPRATQISGALTSVYLIATLAGGIAYAAAGMTFMDAVYHAMTTVATGGFSSKNASIGSYNSAAIDTVSIAFMIIGSLPFILYYKAVQGRPGELWRDSQVRVFFIVLGALIFIMWFYVVASGTLTGTMALRHAAFNVTSIMTGTGYASTDYNAWGPFAIGFFLIMMFIGGCAGSTACSIKIFRYQVLFENIRQHINQLVYPSGIFVKRFNGRPIDDSVSVSVMNFFFLYVVIFGVLAVLLAMSGLDSLTAISGAATAICNVGPGLGTIIGPAGTFHALPDVSKWLLTAGMLVGRLEVFTVLVLFLPSFWAR